jgi:hypothetical protein
MISAVDTVLLIVWLCNWELWIGKDIVNKKERASISHNTRLFHRFSKEYYFTLAGKSKCDLFSNPFRLYNITKAF